MLQITNNDIKGFGWALLSAATVGVATAGASVAISYFTGDNMAGAALDGGVVGAVVGAATQFSKGGVVIAAASAFAAWNALQEMPYAGWSDGLRQTMQGNFLTFGQCATGLVAAVFGFAMLAVTGKKMRASESFSGKMAIRAPAKRTDPNYESSCL